MAMSKATSVLEVAPDHVFTRPVDIPERTNTLVSGIIPGRWQPRRRFDEERLKELADSIKEHGVLNPLRVFVNEAGEFELVSGERRWRAAKLAGLQIVPVEIVEWSARQIQEVAIVDNLQRDDLAPDEEGAAFEAAIRVLGLSEAELARRLGKGRTYIQQRRAIASGAHQLRDALVEGRISFSQARGIIQGAGNDAQIQAVALREVLARLESGFTLAEETARAIGYRALIDSCRKPLEALGWAVVDNSYNTEFHGLIYDAETPPRHWKPAEIFDAMAGEAGSRQPVECERKGVEIPPDVYDALQLRGCRPNTTLAPPWIRVTKPDGDICWADLETVTLLAEEATKDYQALQERYAALGYELRQNGSRNFLGVAKDGQWSTHAYLDWSGALAVLERLEAGEQLAIVDNRPVDRIENQCAAGCGRPGESYNHGPKGYARYCRKCLAKFKMAENEEAKRARRVISARLHAIAVGLDDENLRLLFLMLACGHGSRGNPLIEKATDAALARGDLENTLADRAAKELWPNQPGYPDLRPHLKKLLELDESEVAV